MRLKDKVAIITGGGRGIGRATALRFAEEGAFVVVADIEFAVAQAVAEEIMGQERQVQAAGESVTSSNGGPQALMTRTRVALPVQVDVTNSASVETMVQAALKQFERIDILVNNAGIVRDAQLIKMTEENFDLVMDVNLKGVFNCTKAVVPTMIQQGSGVILSTASVVAPYGNFGQTNYVASKAGVIGMTKVWARELGRKGIRVNAVAPGFTETRMIDGIPDKVIEKLLERIALGRFGKPEDIANAFLWLASDEAAYITGHVLAVDGGTVI
jgi:3-oxoacyl-[acyl-carrier protein] reductase